MSQLEQVAPDRVRRPVAWEMLRTARTRTMTAERVELVSYKES